MVCAKMSGKVVGGHFTCIAGYTCDTPLCIHNCNGCFVINIYLFINVFIYLFEEEFIVHTVIYQLSPLKTEFKSIQF